MQTVPPTVSTGCILKSDAMWLSGPLMMKSNSGVKCISQMKLSAQEVRAVSESITPLDLPVVPVV